MDYFKTMLNEQNNHNKKHKFPSPTLPTQQEIDEHKITHLPYREWCKHCVQGKSRSQHHQRGRKLTTFSSRATTTSTMRQS
eukprot:2468408-Amphidinium_carterae.1